MFVTIILIFLNNIIIKNNKKNNKTKGLKALDGSGSDWDP